MVRKNKRSPTFPQLHPNRFSSEPKFLLRKIPMNISANLPFKHQRFVEDNGSQAVLRAGYQNKNPARIGYGLLRNIWFKHSI